MNRLYAGLAAVLLLGGVAALIGQAWALAALFLIFGAICLGVELRARRPAVRVVMAGGPHAQHELTKAQALMDFQAADTRRNGGYGSF